MHYRVLQTCLRAKGNKSWWIVETGTLSDSFSTKVIPAVTLVCTFLQKSLWESFRVKHKPILILTPAHMASRWKKKKACLIEDFGGFLKSDYGRSPLKKMSGRQMSSNRPPQTKKLCLNSYCVGWNPFLCISQLIMVQSSPRQRSNVHALWYALTHRVTHMLDKLCHVQITFSHSIVLTMEQQRSM